MKRIFRRDCFLKKEVNFRGEKEGIFSGKTGGIFMRRDEYLCKAGGGNV